MNQLKRKLHNSKGASMIIAMVFMLICLFVGGSVLVAATVNTNRIRREKQDHKTQNYLNQRSAAMLIADELKLPGEMPLQLIVRKETRKEYDITFDKNSGKMHFVDPTKPVESVTLAFESVIPEGVTLTAFQKLAYQTAVYKFIADSSVNPDGTPSAIRPRTDFSKFFCPEGEFLTTASEGDIKISFSGEGGSPVSGELDFKPVFACKETNKKNANKEYDFIVGFEKNTGEKYSQLQVSVRSAVGKTDIPTIEEVKGNKCITRKIEQTVISWSGPIIEKGE